MSMWLAPGSGMISTDLWLGFLGWLCGHAKPDRKHFQPNFREFVICGEIQMCHVHRLILVLDSKSGIGCIGRPKHQNSENDAIWKKRLPNQHILTYSLDCKLNWLLLEGTIGSGKLFQQFSRYSGNADGFTRVLLRSLSFSLFGGLTKVAKPSNSVPLGNSMKQKDVTMIIFF